MCHVITSTDTGGAEMMLYKLLSARDDERFAPEVLSLMPVGAIGEKISALNVPVRSLDVPRGAFHPATLMRLRRLLHESRPDVVQTWMYHADLLGGVAARLAGCRRILWNIRHSAISAKTSKRRTYLIARLCARLSRLVPEKIVCCSSVAKQAHTALGYDAGRFVVIPNGFDLRQFRPDAEARRSVLKELSLPDESVLIGLVARFEPVKDHQTFVRAAGALSRAGVAAHYVLCGEGVTAENRDLTDWIASEGLNSCFHLLGRRADIPRMTAAFDIASSSSLGEGFPNVIGEAMACGVPCVATDVGDTAYLLGETGKIVPPANPQALGDAWKEVLTMSRKERQELGGLARCRVEQNFSLPHIVERYEQLYQEVADHATL